MKGVIWLCLLFLGQTAPIVLSIDASTKNRLVIHNLHQMFNLTNILHCRGYLCLRTDKTLAQDKLMTKAHYL